MEVCRLENIQKDFIRGEVITPLKGINLSIEEGDFITIEGVSGTGKSTLLHVLGTLMKPNYGNYFFGDQNVFALGDSKISELRAEKIGFLFQNTNLIQALTLRENIMFASRIGKNVKRSTDELLNRFGLSDRADHLPYQLSGGQMRRAAAIRSIIHSPSLILADEPTNDLDDGWSEEMIRVFKEETERGASVVMVTHNKISTINATKKYRLEDGKLLEI